MSSIRKLSAILLLAVAAGCGTDAITPPMTRLSKSPIHEDQAMTLRQWPTSTSTYANQTAPAYPTLFPLTPRRDMPDYATVAWGPAFFLWNTATMPLTMLDTPPWEETIYRGAAMAPTYTAVPDVTDDASSYKFATKFPIPKPRRP